MQDSTDRRVLFGMRGWNHPSWIQGYYPEDLPADWRPAYYANDCNCVLLSPSDWRQLGETDADELIADIDPAFRFFFEADDSTAPSSALLHAFGRQCGGVLGGGSPGDSDVVHWQADSTDHWKADVGGSLVRLRLDAVDLRALRPVIEKLPDDLAALIIDSDRLAPDSVKEIRLLAEMLGRL